jgi:hypothetical protein
VTLLSRPLSLHDVRNVEELCASVVHRSGLSFRIVSARLFRRPLLGRLPLPLRHRAPSGRDEALMEAARVEPRSEEDAALDPDVELVRLARGLLKGALPPETWLPVVRT